MRAALIVNILAVAIPCLCVPFFFYSSAFIKLIRPAAQTSNKATSLLNSFILHTHHKVEIQEAGARTVLE